MKGRQQCSAGLLKVLSCCFLVVFPVMAYFAEDRFYSVLAGLRHASTVVVELGLDPTEQDFYRYSNQLVQFSTNHVAAHVEDDEFGVEAPGGLKLRRDTQYCQWYETRSTSCERCERTVRNSDGTSSTESYDCNCKDVFYYDKGWRSYRVNSLLFDQPANHYNPQRDPYPSREVFANPATAAGVSIADLLEPKHLIAAERPIRWALGGHKYKPTAWDEKLEEWWRSWWKQAPVRYDHPAALRELRARDEHKFEYMQDGWFFSPYEMSWTGVGVKLVGQYLEGSLFDWQVGDLFGCTAGDVRVRFHVTDPSTVSVVGVLSEHQPVGAHLRVAEDGMAYSWEEFLEHYGASRAAQKWAAASGEQPKYSLTPLGTGFSYHVGMVVMGEVGFEKMAEMARWEELKTVWLSRAGSLLWGVAAGYISVWLGSLRLASLMGSQGSWGVTVFPLLALGMAGVVQAGVWGILLLGSDYDGNLSKGKVVAVFVLSAALVAATLASSSKRQATVVPEETPGKED